MSATISRNTGVRGWVRDPVGRFSWLKTATLALILLPALLLAFRAATGDLGARPWIEANHFTGLWGVRILLVSLMVTPARQVVDSTRVLMLRRMLGVTAACYLGAHFLLYVGDQNGNLLHVASEIVNRFYLTIGFIALVGLLALALTSTNSWQRRLGRGWKRLHKAVYVLTALGILHYFFQSKLDVTNATLLGGVFVWLILWRLEPRRWQPRRWPLPELAILAALLTAVMEAGWYAWRNHAPIERVLVANLDIQRVIHPSVYVLVLGLVVTAVALARPLWRRKPDANAAAARAATRAAQRAARFEAAE